MSYIPTSAYKCYVYAVMTRCFDKIKNEIPTYSIIFYIVYSVYILYILYVYMSVSTLHYYKFINTSYCVLCR